MNYQFEERRGWFRTEFGLGHDMRAYVELQLPNKEKAVVLPLMFRSNNEIDLSPAFESEMDTKIAFLDRDIEHAWIVISPYYRTSGKDPKMLVEEYREIFK